MTAIPPRTDLTAALLEQWQVLDDLVSGLDEARWRTPTCLPGWDVHDVIAHVIGTEAWLDGENPPEIDVSDVDYVRNPIGELNEKFVRAMRPLSGAQLLDRYRDVIGRRSAALRALTDEQWAQTAPVTPVGPAPYGRFMRIRLFDCWLHELDLRDALGVPGDEGGLRADLAFSEFEGSIGYVIGKRGGAPQGSRVTLELTGPLPRTRHIAVTDRARLVDHLDAPATVTLTLDSGLYARLAGGRTTAADHRDDIRIDGDVELGTRLADHLAFTI
jgi:uncharacterized protein (TIGR03083 family)